VLYQKAFEVGNFNWIAFENPPERLRAKVRIRYRQQEQLATITSTSDNSAHIEFDEPQRAIAPGQAAVVYDGDIVLGGGIICSDMER
jgi:tRNA-specific 2-thiouridylase